MAIALGNRDRSRTVVVGGGWRSGARSLDTFEKQFEQSGDLKPR